MAGASRTRPQTGKIHDVIQVFPFGAAFSLQPHIGGRRGNGRHFHILWYEQMHMACRFAGSDQRIPPWAVVAIPIQSASLHAMRESLMVWALLWRMHRNHQCYSQGQVVLQSYLLGTTGLASRGRIRPVTEASRLGHHERVSHNKRHGILAIWEDTVTTTVPGQLAGRVRVSVPQGAQTLQSHGN